MLLLSHKDSGIFFWTVSVGPEVALGATARVCMTQGESFGTSSDLWIFASVVCFLGLNGCLLGEVGSRSWIQEP